MQNPWWIRCVVVALVAGLALAGCSDEPDEGANQTVVNQDEPDVGVDDTGDEPDVEEGDVGEDEDAGDVSDEPDVEEEEPLEWPDVDPVECAHPSLDPECEPGPWGPGSFITRLEIVGDDSCCADLNGDGSIDNLLGTLIGPLSGLPGFGDVNQELSNSIEDGQLAYLMETSGWEHPEYQQSFTLYMHEATALGSPMAANLAGEGSFWLAPWSVVSGTDVRRFVFDEAYVHDGVLHATGGNFWVRFPGLVEAIDAQMENITLTGQVVQTPSPDLTSGGGFSLREAEMGGALMRDKFYESMNEAAADCACVEDGEVFYTYEPAPADRWHCSLKEEVAIACEAGTVECQALAQQQLCDMLAGISHLADVEVDGERAFSIGLSLTSVPTEILGVHGEDD